MPAVKRNFEPAYFISPDVQCEFEENGYVVLRNVVLPEEIESAKELYGEIATMPGFDLHSNFESTGNFKSRDLQLRVFEFLNSLNSKIAPRFANLEACEIGDGGTFFIKPNTAEKSILHPHQDSAVIDEEKAYGIFIWIPLLDITPENGPLYVLPKSHLWGNISRSQHIPWAFRHEFRFLWKKMVPVYVNKTDVICFDTSLIHASGENRSMETRIVACGALLPKAHQKIEYLLKGSRLRKYFVTDDYWLDGGLESSLENFSYEESVYSFPNPVSKKTVEMLLNSF